MNCVSCDISAYHLGLFVFLPGVFLSSRVTGACPVTTDLTMRVNYLLQKMKLHSSCKIEDFVETHICKLCVILRSRVLRVVCPVHDIAPSNR